VYTGPSRLGIDDHRHYIINRSALAEAAFRAVYARWLRRPVIVHWRLVLVVRLLLRLGKWRRARPAWPRARERRRRLGAVQVRHDVVAVAAAAERVVALRRRAAARRVLLGRIVV
jgi:hypothetical protein